MPDTTVAEKVRGLVDAEIAAVDLSDPVRGREVAAFRAALARPREVTVNFSGGITHKCWRVTRSDGDYSVVYMPRAGYFSLCVDSVFGPLDIGVHGKAIDCFGSV